MSASDTFQRVYSRPMPRVYVVPLGVSTKTVLPDSYGICPVRHMCWTISTRHIHFSARGGGLRVLPRVRLSHPLFEMLCAEVDVSACLKGRMRQTDASTSTSDGVASLNWTRSTCVSRGIPGVYGSSLLYRVYKSPQTSSYRSGKIWVPTQMHTGTNI